ncbi:MAG: hypothetical protein HY275_03550 [Gemmatimonadetes bacterium]|nr:hypothetical protein [Gemmatimonadota bacterium]
MISGRRLPPEEALALARARLLRFTPREVAELAAAIASATPGTLPRHARRLEAARRLRCLSDSAAASLALSLESRRAELVRQGYRPLPHD